MSRSYKKHPVHPVACSKSERWDKKFWHSRFRHIVKQHIKTVLLDEDWDIPITINSIAEVWCFNKDGKVWYEKLAYKTGKDIFKNELFYYGRYNQGRVRIITIRELYQWFGK